MYTSIRKIFGALLVAHKRENAGNPVSQNFMIVKGVLFRKTINELGKLHRRYTIPKQKVSTVLKWKTLLQSALLSYTFGAKTHLALLMSLL